MNRKEKILIYEENYKRWQEEANLFHNLLPDFNTLNLKRIDIRGNRNDHNHDEIKKDSYYLFCNNGYWFVSKPNKTSYGWSTSQLRNINILFEIIDMPIVPGKLIERIEIEEDEE